MHPDHPGFDLEDYLYPDDRRSHTWEGISHGSPAFKYLVFDVNLPRDPVAAFNDAMDAINYLNAHSNPNLAVKINK